MNNRQVAEHWARQDKPRGRGSNFYFDGAELYSYGPHFLAAKIVKGAAGQRVALVTSHKRSVSTARHVSYAWQAAGAQYVYFFMVPNVNPGNLGHKENIAYMLDAARDFRGKARRARTRGYREMYQDHAERLARNAAQYATVFDRHDVLSDLVMYGSPWATWLDAARAVA